MNFQLPFIYWQIYTLNTNVTDTVQQWTVWQILLPVVTYEEGINSGLDAAEVF